MDFKENDFQSLIGLILFVVLSTTINIRTTLCRGSIIEYSPYDSTHIIPTVVHLHSSNIKLKKKSNAIPKM